MKHMLRIGLGVIVCLGFSVLFGAYCWGLITQPGSVPQGTEVQMGAHTALVSLVTLAFIAWMLAYLWYGVRLMQSHERDRLPLQHHLILVLFHVVVGFMAVYGTIGTLPWGVTVVALSLYLGAPLIQFVDVLLSLDSQDRRIRM